MASAAYLPFVVQAVLAASITAVVIGASHLLGQRARHTRIKDSAYECGIAGQGVVHTRFSVKFYVTALLFMLFDLEIVILCPGCSSTANSSTSTSRSSGPSCSSSSS